MGRPLGWGIVGFGWVARDHMAPGILAAGDRIVGVADPSSSARTAARAAGLACHADAATLLADPDVEAVYVATPNHLHRPAVEAAAAAGKPVLCEKPMATAIDDARAIVAACGSAGVLYGTAFDQRWHPAHRAIRDAIDDGAIGAPTAVRIVYGCWLARDFSPCEGHDNWRVDPARAGGGAAIDLAPHGIDLVDFLLGEPLIELSAMLQTRAHDYPVDDGAVLMGRTAGRALAQLHVAYNLPDALPRRRLEVTGTAGQIVAENTMGQTPGGVVTVFDAEGRTRALAFDAAESPFAAQAQAFADAVRRREAAPFDGRRDLRHFELLAGALARPAGHLHPLLDGEGQGRGERAELVERTQEALSSPAWAPPAGAPPPCPSPSRGREKVSRATGVVCR